MKTGFFAQQDRTHASLCQQDAVKEDFLGHFHLVSFAQTTRCKNDLLRSFSPTPINLTVCHGESLEKMHRRLKRSSHTLATSDGNKCLVALTIEENARHPFSATITRERITVNAYFASLRSVFSVNRLISCRTVEIIEPLCERAEG